MSNNKKMQTIIYATVTTPVRIIRYISSAVIRIFSPSDDDYPATGVQPFEGDRADKKSP